MSATQLEKRNAKRILRYVKEVQRHAHDLVELANSIEGDGQETKEVWEEIRCAARDGMYLNQMMMDTARDVLVAIAPCEFVDLGIG
jgi:hypothetical protein